jgi:hypothetical protein
MAVRAAARGSAAVCGSLQQRTRLRVAMRLAACVTVVCASVYGRVCTHGARQCAAVRLVVYGSAAGRVWQCCSALDSV